MNPIRHRLQKFYRAVVPFEWRIAFRDWRRVRGAARRPTSAYVDELRAIVAAAPAARGVIAFPPGFGWTTGLFQRPHHLAHELARLGYIVLFMDYTERGAATGFQQVEDQLYIAVLPSGVQRAVFGVLDRAVVLTTTYQYPHLSVFRDPILIYDVLDHLAVFTELHPLESLKKWHADLLQRADMVVCTSDILLRETHALRADAILCPNGVNIDHFAQFGAPPDAMRPILAEGKPIIGYYGTLARWVDYDLIRQSAAALPDCNFVLIGPDADGTFAESGLLVLFVILVFLHSWRALLVPATTVPITLIGAFAFMPFLGFSINLLTLFGLVLAIGIVVDDAIVIVENASHHIERGMAPREATIQAMDEVTGPVIAITIVLMAVFVPTAFLPGITGELYRQFALTIAATAFISAINALTLKPAQCAMYLKPSKGRNIFTRAFDLFYKPRIIFCLLNHFFFGNAV